MLLSRVIRHGTYKQVLGVNLAMLGLVEVLLGDEDAFAEEVLVDLLAVGLGDEPYAYQQQFRLCTSDCAEMADETYIFAVLYAMQDGWVGDRGL